MRYLPHAVAASTGNLHGNITGTRIADLESVPGRSRSLRYAVYLTVTLVNVPGGRKLYGVRYFGPLSFIIGTESFSATTDYDDIISEARSSGASLTNIADKAHAFLSGRVVSPINVGGRWIVR